MDADIFCRVVDNFGDIGVAWRLAQCLTQDQGWQVRIWVDDLTSFKKLESSVQTQCTKQTLNTISIIHWHSEALTITPAKIVIETFGCEIPAYYKELMPLHTDLWINLDYLSAETWVESFHAQPSLQANGLAKFFFYPGFTTKTGGLLREKNFIKERHTFNDSLTFLQQTLNLEVEAERLKISVFCYPGAYINTLLTALEKRQIHYDLIVPDGVLPTLDITMNQYTHYGRLHRYPFVSQALFDRLLWSCDLNLVRGEDSFVRAQWAGKPMLWHIYPQDEATHLIKLQAWLEHYAPFHQDIIALHEGWNHTQQDAYTLTQCWERVLQNLASWDNHAQKWQEKLFFQTDLASQLADFCKDKLK